jgi:ADP-ribosylglycohydrolase
MDKSLGSVIGAFIGDSMGSFLEFKLNVTSEEVELALTMPGGGPFNLIPGQVTDDSELAIALARALIEDPFDRLDGEDDLEYELRIWEKRGDVGRYDNPTIAKHYIEWFNSKPFDRGSTIANALLNATTAEDCYKNAARSGRSESNGGLMRISPLAVYCSTVADDGLVELMVRSEQSMTHSNTTVQNAAIVYVLAIRSLIRDKSSEDAFEKVYRFKSIRDWIGMGNANLNDYIAAIDDRIPANEHIGHAKIAWSYAFYHLKRESSYIEAMRDVLSRGGDTDTNCAIVGGLIGASLGFKKLQEEIPKQIGIFMKCRPNRPYIPSEIIELVKRMRKNCNDE